MPGSKNDINVIDKSPLMVNYLSRIAKCSIRWGILVRLWKETTPETIWMTYVIMHNMISNIFSISASIDSISHPILLGFERFSRQIGDTQEEQNDYKLRHDLI